MGKITQHILKLKNDSWIALDIPLTYPITVSAYLNLSLSTITFVKGETLKQFPLPNNSIKIQLYDNNNGTFSLQLKVDSSAESDLLSLGINSFLVNGKQLYNFWYEGNRYNKGMPDWPSREITKPFPTSTFGSGKKVKYITSGIENITSYEGLRKYVKSINGNKEVSWQPMTDLPNTFQIMINGKNYKKTIAGANGNSGYALHVPSGQNDMVILGLHDVDDNKDVILGSTNTGGTNWGWFPPADGKVYITESNAYNDANKREVVSGAKFLTLIRPISDWISASSLNSSAFMAEGIPIGHRQVLAVGDTSNEVRGEGDTTQYNGSGVRSLKYQGIYDYNGSLPMDISLMNVISAMVNNNVTEIEITICYGVGNKSGNYAWWKVTSPNGQHKQITLSIKMVDDKPAFIIKGHTLAVNEKFEFDSFQLWNTMGHYYITLTATGLGMSINVSNHNKNEPCYMYPHAVRYKKYE